MYHKKFTLHESLITIAFFQNKRSVFLKQNLFKLISELTAKGKKDDGKANFCNNQSAQKNENQKFLKTMMSFFIDNDQL
ncbi:hypothetical protein QX233_09415 [Chryseobacterium gambrini]|uniref:Uncharacterized protein n=1 Tax=Chryseobacterium gambrini TaxID=373672 RepID=A0AAJ1R3L8_9FLAO|nr:MULTISPECIES: hypothetical protein [Chryseobacterium]MDN4012677.1 hypothetical protein [Chryseobacterium gambrini]MDN4030440.1 hypothetical protein [Chryseobacterium gambrini]QWA39279.1 hypothetical protein KKI44_03460 [Chryseobacterium sp. ZHDP1]